MNVLIIKLGATGDVVRTTPLLKRIEGQVTGITGSKNMVLLDRLAQSLRVFSWDQRNLGPDMSYDCVINLEDTLDVAPLRGLAFYLSSFWCLCRLSELTALYRLTAVVRPLARGARRPVFAE